jgi:aminoglycoside phosphotransferase (APT) family kinase protein
VMPFVAGHVPGPAAVLDPWITAMSARQQATLYTNFLDVLARIHHVDARGVLAPRDEFAWWERYLDWSEAAPPELHAALAWCRAARPVDEADPGLLWGDVRFGNAVFDDERGVVGVLDWEMATVGPAEHDVAWFLALESLQAEFLPTPVAGFPARDAAIARYEAHLGRPLRHLEWYETFALVRSTAILARLEHLAGRPFDRNPVLRSLSRRLANQQ